MMVPKFTNQQDMMGFLKALPVNANYSNMLQKDFGIVTPPDAPRYQKEYLWKYLVEGQTNHADMAFSDLVQYAHDMTEKLVAKLPHLALKDQDGGWASLSEVAVVGAPTMPAPKAKKVHVSTRAPKVVEEDGVIVFNEKYQKYDGYCGGKVVSRGATIAKVEATLRGIYKVTSVEVK